MPDYCRVWSLMSVIDYKGLRYAVVEMVPPIVLPGVVV
jgi:hypothetical protein